MPIPKPNYHPPLNVIRAEQERVRRDVSSAAGRRWQLPARAQWYTQASRFAGVEPREPARKGNR